MGIQKEPAPNLAMNTYQPQPGIAANSAHIEEQALQLLLKDQTNIAQDTVRVVDQAALAKISQAKKRYFALLQDAYPADDEPALQEKLTRLIFASEVLGRLSVR